MDNRFNPSREEARSIECLACGAKPGHKCVKWKRREKVWAPRESNHQERVDDYVVKYGL